MESHFLVKSIQLYDFICSREDFQLEAFRSTTPLRVRDIVGVKCEGLTRA